MFEPRTLDELGGLPLPLWERWEDRLEDNLALFQIVSRHEQETSEYRLHIGSSFRSFCEPELESSASHGLRAEANAKICPLTAKTGVRVP
jgi:hypothetical protein